MKDVSKQERVDGAAMGFIPRQPGKAHAIDNRVTPISEMVLTSESEGCSWPGAR